MTQNEKADRIRHILIGVKHSELKDAILADLFDVIPIVGDVSNISRAIQEREKTHKARQIVDLFAGALPDPIGGAIDFLTPTNTIKYFSKGHLTPADRVKTAIRKLKG
jgi:hypothetical protein